MTSLLDATIKLASIDHNNDAHWLPSGQPYAPVFGLDQAMVNKLGIRRRKPVAEAPKPTAKAPLPNLTPDEARAAVVKANAEFQESRVEVQRLKELQRQHKAAKGVAIRNWMVATAQPMSHGDLVRDMIAQDIERRRKILAGEIEAPAMPRAANSHIDRATGRGGDANDMVRSRLRYGGFHRSGLPSSYKGQPDPRRPKLPSGEAA